MNVIKNILVATLPALVLLLLLMEVLFRTAIPASHQPRGQFHAEDAVYAFNPDVEEGVMTAGWLARHRTQWRINNVGWNYPIDYEAHDEGKTIAVIGDSYIEALQVDVGKSYPYLLHERLADEGYRVYAFGTSGAPLTQYLHLSRYAAKHFDPDILVINIVHNDFDESIREVKPHGSYFLQVSIDDDGNVIERAPRPSAAFYENSLSKRLLYQSAVVRYVWFNLQAKAAITRLMNPRPDEAFDTNIDVEAVARIEPLIRSATAYVIRALAEEHRDRRVILVFDAPRSALYRGALEEYSGWWLHPLVAELSDAHGLELIDLTPHMASEYETTGVMFNAAHDFHWDAYGHAFVADVLYDHLMGEPRRGDGEEISFSRSAAR